MRPSSEDALVQMDIDGPGDVEKPRIVSNGFLPMSQLTVREDGHYQTSDPEWDLSPRRSARCSGWCTAQEHRCQLRECHRQECACWRCLVACIGKLSANPADREDENMRVCGEMLKMERVDADLHQQGRYDDLRATQDCGVTLEIPTTAAVGGKHIQGFAIAHVQEATVSWCLVVADVRTELWKDNHHSTPPLMMSSAIFESCIIMVQRPWSTRRKDTRMGRTRGFFTWAPAGCRLRTLCGAPLFGQSNACLLTVDQPQPSQGPSRQ